MWTAARKKLAMMAFAVALGVGAADHAEAAACSVAQGQIYLDQRNFLQAVQEFSCVIANQPTEWEGYQGRITAELMLGQFSEAVRDYAMITAKVFPVHPNAKNQLLADFDKKVGQSPQDIVVLTGASSARWWYFEYAPAIQLLNRLLDIAPDDVYGNLFRGSSRMLSGKSATQGIADVEKALQLAPANPSVRFIVADAYTYGQPNAARAFAEANLALQWGLNTPRIHAILARCYEVFGDPAAAAAETLIHINQVTTDLESAPWLVKGVPWTVPFEPGVVREFTIYAVPGETLSISTASRDIPDTIMVLLTSDGKPVKSSDDANKYLAAFTWVVPKVDNYLLRVTSFEGVGTGSVTVTRQ